LAQPLAVLVLELVALCLAVALVPLVLPVGPKLVRLLVEPEVAEPHLLLMVQYPEVARQGFHTPPICCLLQILIFQ
jgi:hypothetical protein